MLARRKVVSSVMPNVADKPSRDEAEWYADVLFFDYVLRKKRRKKNVDRHTYIHLGGFGGDWGVYWGTCSCKAGPNSGQKRAGTAKNGGVTCRGASCPGGTEKGGKVEGTAERWAYYK